MRVSFPIPDKSTISTPVGTTPNLTTENSKRPHRKNSPVNKQDLTESIKF